MKCTVIISQILVITGILIVIIMAIMEFAVSGTISTIWILVPCIMIIVGLIIDQVCYVVRKRITSSRR